LSPDEKALVETIKYSTSVAGNGGMAVCFIWCVPAFDSARRPSKIRVVQDLCSPFLPTELLKSASLTSLFTPKKGPTDTRRGGQGTSTPFLFSSRRRAPKTFALEGLLPSKKRAKVGHDIRPKVRKETETYLGRQVGALVLFLPRM